MIKYVWACPHLPCRGSDSLEESDLRPARPGVLTAERQCNDCGAWARIVVTGPYRELKVEKGAAPAVMS
jgi:transposase